MHVLAVLVAHHYSECKLCPILAQVRLISWHCARTADLYTVSTSFHPSNDSSRTHSFFVALGGANEAVIRMLISIGR